MTNSEILEQFSKVTGIGDPKVEQIVRHQESWVYKNFDKNVTTCAAIDEGNGDAFNSVTWGTWPSWEDDVKKATEQSAEDYKKYVDGDWEPHKAQEKFPKSKKQYRATSTKSMWGAINQIHTKREEMINAIRSDFNNTLWPNGRGAAFGDEEYYDAEWQEVEKPLALPPHEEEKE
jgi:hypothetical protein